MLRYFKILNDAVFNILLRKSEREIFIRNFKLRFLVPFRKRNNRIIPYDSNEVWRSIERQILESKSIIIVLSGPSSKLFKQEYNFGDTILCTNNSYRSVRKFKSSFIYFLFDHYYTLRYLKIYSFIKDAKVILFQKEASNYPGWTRYNNRLEKFALKLFIEKEVSNQEILLNKNVNSQIYDEIISYWHNNFGWKGFRDNSGILLIMLGAYFASKYDKKLTVYGFDMGYGGLVHADSTKSASIKNFVDEETRVEMKSILSKIDIKLTRQFLYKSYFPFKQ